MRPSLFVALSFVLVLLPACSRTTEESCNVVCARNAVCQPGGPGESSCNSICVDLAKDEDYAATLDVQADCYEEQVSRYGTDDNQVCLALEGGACGVGN